MAPRGSIPLAAALVALVLVPGGAEATSFEHPDFATNARRPRRIVVLPPQSEIVRARVTDATPLVKETAALERGIAEGTAASLDALGYDGDAVTLDPARANADRDLMALVKELQDRVDGILGNVTRRPRDVRAGRFTLGEAVLPLAARTGAEGFLVVRAQSVVPSKGQRALSALLGAAFGGVPVPPTNVTRGIVVLVDARTGDVAWLDAAQVGGAVVKESERVGGRLAEAMLRQYPRAGVVHKARKAGRGGAERGPSAPLPEDDAPGETDAIIAEFEKVAKDDADVNLLEPAPAAATPEPGAATPEPGTEAPVVEDVAPRNEFNGAGGLAARASDGEVLAPDVAAAAPAAVEAAPPAPGLLAEIRALWDVPAAQRPPATRQIVFQMLDGGPGIVVRNMSEPAVRVSLDLGPWIQIEAGARRDLGAAAGSHRILVSSADGVEIARASCIVGARSLAMAEVWPVN